MGSRDADRLSDASRDPSIFKTFSLFSEHKIILDDAEIELYGNGTMDLAHHSDHSVVRGVFLSKLRDDTLGSSELLAVRIAVVVAFPVTGSIKTK